MPSPEWQWFGPRSLPRAALRVLENRLPNVDRYKNAPVIASVRQGLAEEALRADNHRDVDERVLRHQPARGPSLCAPRVLSKRPMQEFPAPKRSRASRITSTSRSARMISPLTEMATHLPGYSASKGTP